MLAHDASISIAESMSEKWKRMRIFFGYDKEKTKEKKNTISPLKHRLSLCVQSNSF
jgi:hypothetical protein